MHISPETLLDLHQGCTLATMERETSAIGISRRWLDIAKGAGGAALYLGFYDWQTLTDKSGYLLHLDDHGGDVTAEVGALLFSRSAHVGTRPQK